MEEEVIKHTKKIFNALDRPGRSFWEKTAEVTVEIFIIVFAVTLSIWLHAWFDHRHEQKECHEFLVGIKDDLTKDIQLLEDNKTALIIVDSNFHFVRRLNSDNTIDTASEQLIAHHIDISLVATHSNIGRYDGFKSSGKLGTIENDSLKQKILVYYQQTMPGVTDIEAVVNSLQTRILDAEIEKDNKTSVKEIVKTFKMKALLQLGTENIDEMIQAYGDAQQQAKMIILMIDNPSVVTQ